MVQIAIDDDHLTGYRTFDGWMEVKVSGSLTEPGNPAEREARFLNIANKILAEQRQIAFDHEHHGNGGKGETWQGAALIKTVRRKVGDRWEGGRYYVSSNTQLANSPAIRNCAETLAITDGFNHEGNDMEIERIVFMGGRANNAEKQILVPGEEGKRGTPCGTCRDAIYKHRLKDGGQTKVTLLPANIGDMEIVPFSGNSDTRMEELKRNEAYDTTIDALLPHPQLFMMKDPTGERKKTIRAGWDYLRDPLHYKALEQVKEAEALEHIGHQADPEAIFKAVNALMMDEMTKMYHDSGGKVKSASVVILRSESGQYYLGTASVNAGTSDMHPAYDHAIKELQKGHLLNRATDVFVMSCDFAKFPDLFAAPEKDAAADIGLRMPDGDARERVKKISSLSDGARDLSSQPLGTQNANFHLFLPNDVAGFNPERHRQRFTLKELLPHAYMNPRTEQLLGGAARH